MPPRKAKPTPPLAAAHLSAASTQSVPAQESPSSPLSDVDGTTLSHLPVTPDPALPASRTATHGRTATSFKNTSPRRLPEPTALTADQQIGQDEETSRPDVDFIPTTRAKRGTAAPRNSGTVLQSAVEPSSTSSRRGVTIGATPSRNESPAVGSGREDSPLRRSGRSRKRTRYTFEELADKVDAQHSYGDNTTSTTGGHGRSTAETAATVPLGPEGRDDADVDAEGEALPVEAQDVPLQTPAKRTPKRTTKAKTASTSASASTKPKGASAQKLQYDEDADDPEDKGKLRSFTWSGTNAEHRARALKGASNKQRAYSYAQLLPLYEPPDLQTLEAGLVVDAADNEDEPDQGDHGDGRPGIAWPQDGLARTRLQSVTLAHRKTRVKYWTTICGAVPALLLHDMLWWPGKAFGYKEEMTRGRWAEEARLRADGSASQQRKVGWPFVHPNLDVSSVKLLSDDEASVYRPGARTATAPQRPMFKHPVHVSGSVGGRAPAEAAVGITTTPGGKRKKGASKPSAATAAGPDGDGDEADHNSDAENAEDEAAEAEAEATASKVDVSLADPKYKDLQNLGLEERWQDPSKAVQVWLGPHDRQQQVTISPGASVRLSEHLEGNEGHILNAGGHVYALDWVPVPIHLNRGKEYVAICAALSARPSTMLGAKAARPLLGCIQIWSVSPDAAANNGDDVRKGKAVLELNVCIDSGTAFQLVWCPAGHDYRREGTPTATSSGDDDSFDGDQQHQPIRRLSLLAGVFEDGTALIFAPPHPDDVRRQQQSHDKGKRKVTLTENDDGPLSIKLEPVLRLELASTSITCLDWSGGEQLAVGCSNGYIAVFAVGDALRCGHLGTGATAIASRPLRPMHYIATHACPITSLSYFSVPPMDSSGVLHATLPPHLIFSVSLDGNITLSNLLDGTVRVSEHQRHAHGCSEFSAFLQNFINENGECNATMFGMRPDELGRQKGVASLSARVTAMASSAFHPVAAIGSAAGEVKLTNMIRASRRSGNGRGHAVKAQTPLFRLVTNRKTGDLKMLDNFLIETTTSREDKHINQPSSPPQVDITTLRWNQNIGRGLFLASGTGSGLVRLDWVENRLKVDGSSAVKR